MGIKRRQLLAGRGGGRYWRGGGGDPRGAGGGGGGAGGGPRLGGRGGGGEAAAAPKPVAAADLGEQQVDARRGDRVEVRPDRGEWRDVVGGLRHVVEADHADVLRNPAAPLVQ